MTVDTTRIQLIQREVIDQSREWLEDHLSDDGLPLWLLRGLREAGLDSASIERELVQERNFTFNINN